MRDERPMTNDAEPCQIADDLWSVAVANSVGPSGQPTNVYVVGRSPALLIDSGSDDGGATVLTALERLGIDRLERIVLTHAHQDHSGNSDVIRDLMGPTVAIHQRAQAFMKQRNMTLHIDRFLTGGEIISAGPYHFEVIETPGHAPDHISLYEPSLKALFAGDLLSGNGTIAVVPPNGSMGEYLDSLRRVQELEIETIYPGHGPVIRNGNERISEYIAHRERREEEIYQEIAAGNDTIEAITDRLYQDVLPRIRPQAAGTVLAHVIHLVERGRVCVAGGEAPSLTTRFVVASNGAR
jgi:glyoxylase-like metal-dependent hydrolase (beta-lactamase superfamily II)